MCTFCGGVMPSGVEEQPMNSGVYPCLCDQPCDDPDYFYEYVKGQQMHGLDTPQPESL